MTSTKYGRADHLTQLVIGAAIEVHRVLGPGLIESIYQKCMKYELQARSIPFNSEVRIPLRYKEVIFEENLRMDLYVDDCLIVELKVVESILPVHKAQLMSYMKLLDIPLGLLINFHSALLKHGIHRLILPGTVRQ